MKYLMMAAALCAGTLSAQAQSTPTESTSSSATATAQKPTPQARKDCLKTTDADWKALGLTAEQMTQVKAIQAEHEKACTSMKKDDTAGAAAMVDQHEARIKEVLTPTQYDSWQKQCTAMAAPAKPMEKK